MCERRVVVEAACARSLPEKLEFRTRAIGVAIASAKLGDLTHFQVLACSRTVYHG